MTKRSWIAAGVALVALVVAIVVPTTLVGQASSDEPSDGPVKGVDARTRALLGVFERPRTADDALPQPSGDDPATPDDLPGEAFELSRRVEPPGDGGPVYLWPKRGGACFSTAGVSSCADASLIEQRGVIPAFYQGSAIAAGRTRVAGIARDGIDSVTVVLAGWNEVDVPVRDNAFRADVAGMPIELRWTGADGEEASQRVPSPPPAPR